MSGNPLRLIRPHHLLGVMITLTFAILSLHVPDLVQLGRSFTSVSATAHLSQSRGPNQVVYRLRVSAAGGDISSPTLTMDLPPGQDLHPEGVHTDQHTAVPTFCKAGSSLKPLGAVRDPEAAPHRLTCLVDTIPVGHRAEYTITATLHPFYSDRASGIAVRATVSAESLSPVISNAVGGDETPAVGAPPGDVATGPTITT